MSFRAPFSHAPTSFSHGRIALFALFALAGSLAFAACGDDDDEPGATGWLCQSDNNCADGYFCDMGMGQPQAKDGPFSCYQDCLTGCTEGPACPDICADECGLEGRSCDDICEEECDSDAECTETCVIECDGNFGDIPETSPPSFGGDPAPGDSAPGGDGPAPSGDIPTDASDIPGADPVDTDTDDQAPTGTCAAR